MITAGTRLCLCAGFTEARVPSAEASNTCMGKGFVVHTVSENQRQGPMSDKFLQISTNVLDAHVHCKISSVSLVRAVFFCLGTLK